MSRKGMLLPTTSEYGPSWPKLFTSDTYIWFHKLKKWVAWKPHIYAYWQGKYQPIEDEV